MTKRTHTTSETPHHQSNVKLKLYFFLLKNELFEKVIYRKSELKKKAIV